MISILSSKFCDIYYVKMISLKGKLILDPLNPLIFPNDFIVNNICIAICLFRDLPDAKKRHNK